MNTRELCESFGINRRTATRWLKAGCPHRKTGTHKTAPTEFDRAEVIAWLDEVGKGDGADGLAPSDLPQPPAPAAPAAGTSSPTTPSATDLGRMIRVANLQIKRLEAKKRQRLEAEATGELVPLADVRRAWASQIEVVHASFRAIPATLATRLVGKAYDEIRDTIEVELRGVLTSFAVEELSL